MRQMTPPLPYKSVFNKPLSNLDLRHLALKIVGHMKDKLTVLTINGMKIHDLFDKL